MAVAAISACCALSGKAREQPNLFDGQTALAERLQDGRMNVGQGFEAADLELVVA